MTNLPPQGAESPAPSPPVPEESPRPPQRGQGSHPLRVTEAVQLAATHLRKLQHSDGYWWGELESNCSIQAEYLLVTHFLGAPDPSRWRKIVQYLRSQQQADGGWSVWRGGPGDLNITVEAYFAMKLAGVDAKDPAMVSARTFILENGGVAHTRVFTRMWLALFGQWDWKATPSLPPEIMLLPNWFPFNIYEFASWARASIVACTVLLNLRPVCPIPDSAHIDELYPQGRGMFRTTAAKGRTGASIYGALVGAIKALEHMPVKPLRRAALKRAEQWMLQHQEADGSWGGIQPPWAYSLMALKTLGYPLEHPVMRKGLRGFETFGREDADTWHMDPCISPVWDTCLALLALQDAGMPADEPWMVQAADWLVRQQVLTGGDWQIKNPKAAPGGWPFEFHNDHYPDIDDSAMVLIALKKAASGLSAKLRQAGSLSKAISAGLAWTASMQSRNGGWGSFDKDNTKAFVGNLPFCDFGEVLDPPTEDVTAHMVEALARCGMPSASPVLRRGLAYLKATQQADGSWFGRWGVNHIYGVGTVLPAYKAAGEDMAQPAVRRAVDWLAQHQNNDGGWGETCESYLHPAQRGRGPSTASQTAWALLGLLAAGESHSHPVRRGVQYLLDTQDASGGWNEPSFTGTGFPGAFMLKYHLYGLYWPLMALGQYRQAMRLPGA